MKHIYLLPLICLIACSTNKSEKDTQAHLSDTLKSPTNNDGATQAYDVFSGEYSIGDGETIIVPYNNFYLMKNEKGEVTDSLYAMGKEQALFVYANRSNSIVFKMDPDHKSGMYFESDEKWPVRFIKSIPEEETELEESERIFKQRYLEDSIAFAELDRYDGTYEIQTESEGVNAQLVLQYKNDMTFNYTWSFNVASGEVSCKAHREGVLMMDRTQHGFDRVDDCMMHFNFNGLWDGGMVIEIDFEDQFKCNFIKGNECTFSGAYVKKDN
ncbi:hypothetical protein QQ054_21140 [Oscillatoria amoena NRMC-F 0135]|nr:hypothetical protein [Oscillatoria amoena NRMC-F 0135]